MTSRQRYDERHDQIRADVLRMGTIADEMLRLAVDSTISGDIGLARRVIEMDDEVDALERECLKNTILAMCLESPVATDLMVLTATFNVIGEVEKVADDAVKLARRSSKLVGHFPGEMKLALSQLGETSIRMFNAALRVYSDYSADLAEEIVKGDKEADTQYRDARRRVIDMIRTNPNDTEHLVRTIDAFHALEHVADRAVEIASKLQKQYF